MNQPTLPRGLHFFERGWLSSNSLLIRDSEHAVVFDTGYMSHAPQLQQLIQAQIGVQPIDLIVNSHLHSDHCGGNHWLQSIYESVDIQIPYRQFQDVSSWNESALTYQVSGQNCLPFKPTRHLIGGESVFTAGLRWNVYSAPGHDNDECIFFEPDHKILFSADALWEQGLGVVFPEFLGGTGFENVILTLDLIESLKPQIILPGHGPVFYDLKASLSSARTRLEQFVRQPEIHAFYSAKVLLKFKLLEIQEIALEDFLIWCAEVQMLDMIHQRFFENKPKHTWIEYLIKELIARKAATLSNGRLLNQ